MQRYRQRFVRTYLECIDIEIDVDVLVLQVLILVILYQRTNLYRNRLERTEFVVADVVEVFRTRCFEQTDRDARLVGKSERHVFLVELAFAYLHAGIKQRTEHVLASVDHLLGINGGALSKNVYYTPAFSEYLIEKTNETGEYAGSCEQQGSGK